MTDRTYIEGAEDYMRLEPILILPPVDKKRAGELDTTYSPTYGYMDAYREPTSNPCTCAGWNCILLMLQ